MSKTYDWLPPFFFNPLVSFIGAIVSIIGVLLAIYFYAGSRQIPKLVYYVHPAKAVVMKAGKISKLSAYYDQKPIKTDITVAQIAIWNDGTSSIKLNNILSPIIIYTEGNIPILEATIRKLSRKVTGLALDQDGINKGQLGVSWTILEPKDGGIIQVIYAGDTDVKLLASGIIEGQDQIECLKLLITVIDRLQKKGKISEFFYLLMGISYLFMGISLILVSLIQISRGNWTGTRKYKLSFYLPTGLMSLGGGIYFLYSYVQIIKIPFGF